MQNRQSCVCECIEETATSKMGTRKGEAARKWDQETTFSTTSASFLAVAPHNDATGHMCPWQQASDSFFVTHLINIKILVFSGRRTCSLA